MVSTPPDLAVGDTTAVGCSKKDTLRELIPIDCSDYFVVAMLADLTISGFELVTDIDMKIDPVVIADGAMAQPSRVNVERVSSVRKSTLHFPMSKSDFSAITINTPFAAAVPAKIADDRVLTRSWLEAEQDAWRLGGLRHVQSRPLYEDLKGNHHRQLVLPQEDQDARS